MQFYEINANSFLVRNVISDLSDHQKNFSLPSIYKMAKTWDTFSHPHRSTKSLFASKGAVACHYRALCDSFNDVLNTLYLLLY